MTLYTKVDQASLVTQHLSLLGYKEGDTVHYRAFLPHVPGVKNADKGRKTSAPFGNVPSDLAQWESENRGVYVVVNKGGAGIDEITECTAFFYEHDALDKEASAALWEGLSLPEPTFQVDTGGKSIHSYWVLDQPIGSLVWRNLQTDLLEYADADRSLKNQNRVMRLPGFIHPVTGQTSTLIKCSGKRYSYKTLRQLIPGPAVKEQAAKPQSAPSAPAASYEEEKVHARELLNYIPRRQPGSGTYEDSFKVLAALVHKFGPVEGLALAREWSPDEDWGEDLDRKAASLRGGPRPVTFGSLVRMAEGYGYRRPVKSESWSQKPKTLEQSQASPVSQENGYAAFRLAVAGVLALEDPAEREFELQNVKDKFRKPMALVRRIVQELTRLESTVKREFTLRDLEQINSVGVPYLIPRFIPEKGLVMLGGEAKGGKSKLTYEMIGALLGNRPFMGYKPKPDTRILMIQAEENEITMSNNFEGVGALFNGVDNDRLLIKKDWDIDDTSTLERWIAEHNPDLVVIDSFKAANQSTGVSENAPEAANPVYALQKMLHSVGIAGLLIHHTNKNKDAQGVQKLGGTGGLPAACDNIILLSRLSENPEDSKRLLSLYGRELSGRFQVKLDDSEFPKYTWELLQEIGQDAESANLQQRVLSLMEQNQDRHLLGMTAGFLKDVLNLPSENKSIYKALNALVQSSIINCQRSTNDKRVRLYSLPRIQTAQTHTEQGLEKVSIKYPSHVPEVSQDNFWGEGKAKGADPISFDGAVAQYRVNAAPALPVRTPSLLPAISHQKTEKVSKQGDGYFMDTFSNADTASVSAVSIQSPSEVHTHAETDSKAPFEIGDVVVASYPGVDATDYSTAINSGQPTKGTVGVVQRVVSLINAIDGQEDWTVYLVPVDGSTELPASSTDIEMYLGE